MPEPKLPQSSFEKKPLTIFAMDAPNVDASFGLILNRAPLPAERMRMDVLIKWLRQKAHSNNSRLYAKIFVNRPIEEDAWEKQLGWILVIQNMGYDVYSKPRATADSDVDEDIVDYLYQLTEAHEVAEIVLASNDGQRFHNILEILACNGVKVTILGFNEFPSILTRNELFEFVPYSSIPGLMPATGCQTESQAT